MPERQVIEAELTLTPEGWRRGVRVAVDRAGRIEAVGALEAPPTRSLPGRALLPGMVNAHSHAFQRGLRGRGEAFPEGAGSFWSWREAMYGLVESLDEGAAYELSRRAFREMRAAGMTSVGEFHYLRHDGPGIDFAFDRAVLRAAADAGIRIVLLSTHYRTGGIGKELSGGQLRFRTESLAEYWGQMERLESLIEPATQSLGVAAHSMRAVPVEEVAALHAEATRRGLVFHMHLEEQPAEIEASLEHYGKRPMDLVNEHLRVHDRTTMVHCTHTSPDDLARFLEAGGAVCICPLTEANLGDGLADVPLMLERGGSICLGTDSNARISMLEEMRLLEYGQRLRTRSRGVCRDGRGAVAPVLWTCATLNGARSLGIDAGLIEPGRLADFVAVDLDHPSLSGWDDESLLAALVLGAPDGVVAATCVGGAWKEVGRDRPPL
jgi:formimidoylglutamate deiminase